MIPLPVLGVIYLLGIPVAVGISMRFDQDCIPRENPAGVDYFLGIFWPLAVLILGIVLAVKSVAGFLYRFGRYGFTLTGDQFYIGVLLTVSVVLGIPLMVALIFNVMSTAGR